jgi:UDP-glucose 4-epimerase
MKIMLLGAAGFIGTNLVIKLAQNENDLITVVDKNEKFFQPIQKFGFKNVSIKECGFSENENYPDLLKGQDIVFHLVSTTVPTTSNQHISQELSENVVVTAKILEGCVQCSVGKVVFISSGGGVYGKESVCPLSESSPTNPITSYGIQKITIEKLLYLYNYIYGLDYRIVRLANPYGPYQRPNGILGAVTTFTYKALKQEEITVYGDGSVVRDFIFIDDAVKGILNVVKGENKHKIFNLGSGKGTSINDVLKTVQKAVGTELNIKYIAGRKVDVPVNYLDISRYEKYFGRLNPISLFDGIQKTAGFMRVYYEIQHGGKNEF